MFRKYSLEPIVFVSGAVVMTLEIVGSRVLAPYVGTSIVAWTSIIGSILASLSLGYWWGGALADAKPTYQRFSLILFISAVSITLLAWGKDYILAGLSEIPDLRTRSLFAALILFAPASTALGMISPFAVRLRMHEVATSGRTVGRLYAISTVGSIVGTFATGFVLISYFGTSNILFLLAGIQLLSSFIAFPLFQKHTLVGIGFLVASYLSPHSFFPYQAEAFRDIDTAYNRVWVYDVREGPRTIRYLDTEYYAHQSGMDVHQPNELIFEYTKMYRLADHFKSRIERALLIGGGGYSTAKDFLLKHPAATLDVVEIDPGLTAIAEEFFHKPTDRRMRVIHQDARMFINESSSSYDVIIGDVFRSSYSIPYHLTTVEAIRQYKRMLTSGGVMLLNIISSLDGPDSIFLNSEYQTFRSEFPHVYLFPVDPVETQDIQNILLVASLSEKTPDLQSTNAEYMLYLQRLWKQMPTSGILLTDEYAPVEQFLAKTL